MDAEQDDRDPRDQMRDDRAARLREARSDAGYRSARAAAFAHDWVESTYRSHENGTRPYDEKDATRYSKAFQVAVSWLYHGRGKKSDAAAHAPASEVSPPERTQTSGRLLPVVGVAAASDRGRYILTSQVVERVPAPPGLDLVEDAYAVYVQNDSMEPRYFAGEILYIHPGKPVRRGDFILIQIEHENGDIEPLVKRLVGETADAYELEQYNPPRKFSVERRQVRAVHFVHSAGSR